MLEARKQIMLAQFFYFTLFKIHSNALKKTYFNVSIHVV